MYVYIKVIGIMFININDDKYNKLFIYDNEWISSIWNLKFNVKQIGNFFLRSNNKIKMLFILMLSMYYTYKYYRYLNIVKSSIDLNS